MANSQTTTLQTFCRMQLKILLIHMVERALQLVWESSRSWVSSRLANGESVPWTSSVNTWVLNVCLCSLFFACFYILIIYFSEFETFEEWNPDPEIAVSDRSNFVLCVLKWLLECCAATVYPYRQSWTLCMLYTFSYSWLFDTHVDLDRASMWVDNATGWRIAFRVWLHCMELLTRLSV